MAKVRVNIQQAELGQLPRVCICCGAPAKRTVSHKFYYMPAWLVVLRYVLPKIINYIYGYQSVTLSVPVCERHGRRLQLPYYVMYGMVGVLLLASVSAILLYVLEMAEFGAFIILPVILLLIPTLIGIIVLQLITPRAEGMTERTVDFTAVSDQFAQAINPSRATTSLGGIGPAGGFAPMYGSAAMGQGGGAPSSGGGSSALKLTLIIAGSVGGAVVLLGCGGCLGLHLLMTSRQHQLAHQPPDFPEPPDFPQPPNFPQHVPPNWPNQPVPTPDGRPWNVPGATPDFSQPADPFPATTPQTPEIPGGTTAPGTFDTPAFPEREPVIPTTPSVPRPTVPGTRPSSFPANPPGSLPITPDIKLAAGDKVWALWGGKWFPAQVLQPTPGGAKIHYDDHSSSWDEVLPADKLLLAEAPKQPVATDVASTDTPPEPAPTPPQPRTRTWTDTTGQFKIDAEYVGFEDGKVQLKRADGTTVSVPLEKLNAADQQYVRSRNGQ